MSRESRPIHPGWTRELPEDKPLVYRIQTGSAETNYVSVGNEAASTIAFASIFATGRSPVPECRLSKSECALSERRKGDHIISRTKPKYNEVR